jgi:putative transport protein
MGKLNSSVATIERGDVYIVPQPSARLELGDRVGLIIKRDRIPAARDFFGDTIKSTADINYVTLGIGMVVGVILGLITLPIPGLGNLSLGLAGGPLIAALFFGYFGNFAGLDWNLPLSANLTLRNFGLTLFLATVGIRSGPTFVSALQGQGLQLLFAGAAITLAVVVVVLVVGHYLLKLDFDELLGVTSGTTGNPAILSYASRTTQSEQPDISYAIVFPAMTIVKILVTQMMMALFYNAG